MTRDLCPPLGDPHWQRLDREQWWTFSFRILGIYREYIDISRLYPRSPLSDPWWTGDIRAHTSDALYDSSFSHIWFFSLFSGVDRRLHDRSDIYISSGNSFCFSA
jgi:hypothetical protein